MRIEIRSTVLRRIVESIPFVKRCWIGLVFRAWPPWEVRFLSLRPFTEADRIAHISWAESVIADLKSGDVQV